MVPIEILSNVVMIKYQSSHQESKQGSAFFVNHENKQYLVTAGHVIDGMKKRDKLFIFNNKKFIEVDAQIIAKGNPHPQFLDYDFAILFLTNYINDSAFQIPIHNDTPLIGQQVYFLGFPFGLNTEYDYNKGFPLPLVKSATSSGNSFSKGRGMYLLDGHSNPGFSGGPAIFKSVKYPNHNFKVFGIVSSVIQEELLNIRNVPSCIVGNSGIIQCVSITTVFNTIKRRQ